MRTLRLLVPLGALFLAVALGSCGSAPGGDSPTTAPTTTHTDVDVDVDETVTPACSPEQLTTLFADSGEEIEPSAFTEATGDFHPGHLVADLPAICVATFTHQGEDYSVAALPNLAETVSELDARVTAGGGTVGRVEPMSVTDVDSGIVVYGPFTAVTTSTLGFDDVDDLAVVLSSPAGH